MELLQDKKSGEFKIRPEGTHDQDTDIHHNWTDSIGYWVNKGHELSDGKVVKKEVKRIVNKKSGVNLDQKFLNLENDNIKKMAGRELLFDLMKSTLVPAFMTEQEYEDARNYRQLLSAEARGRRWNKMLSRLASPKVLENSGKIAFLSETLKKYKEDYVLADNKIFENFIEDEDHPLATLPGYRDGELDFSTSGKGLSTLDLWDNPEIGGPNNDYRDLVTDIIKKTIVEADQYIIE